MATAISLAQKNRSDRNKKQAAKPNAAAACCTFPGASNSSYSSLNAALAMMAFQGISIFIDNCAAIFPGTCE
jgi:hypothetical protein